MIVREQIKILTQKTKIVRFLFKCATSVMIDRVSVLSLRYKSEISACITFF